MAEKTWYNIQPFWDNRWLIRVDEQDASGIMLQKIYAPCCDYFDRNLGEQPTQEDLSDMIETTAEWHRAIRGGTTA